MRAMHVTEEVLGLFAATGGNTYSEQVSMQQHALQAAALARASGASDALVLAALLHDVGHFLAQPDSEFGVTDHGTRHLDRVVTAGDIELEFDVGPQRVGSIGLDEDPTLVDVAREVRKQLVDRLIIDPDHEIRAR